MRVLQLIQKKQLRGAEIFATLLSQHLLKQGHEALVLALLDGNGDLPSNEWIEALNARPDRMIDLTGWFRLARIIRQWKPDVVQANAGDTLRYAVVSKLLFRWRTPVVFRNASVMSRYLGYPAKKWMYRHILNQVRAVASVSETSRRDLLRLFPGLQDRVEVIPIGIEPDLLDTVLPSASVNGDFILHVGGFTYEKNHAGLLRICRHIWEVRPDIKLLLAGDGPLLQQIKQEVASNGDDDRVLFLGNVDQIGPLMKKARVLMLPSIIEGLPAVVLEAMYCRLPIVAYDTGGIHEVIRHGTTGWLTRAGDEKGFADAVLDVLNNPSRADLVKAKAQAFVSTHFLNAQVAERFLYFYEDVISGVQSDVAPKTITPPRVVPYDMADERRAIR